ncbi:peptidoglycan DD-metalloendopeptidase family protein [Winogradskyella sp. 4-2091]|uniref:peptidoglycan DD-metalloendopeptidase family protein n=1 Tax=Winogradskyella sp. 4-2091 TaxID=3381659 RepID=UPI003892519E
MPVASFEILLNSINAYPIIEALANPQDCVTLDLSIDNEALLNINISSSKDLDNYITNYITYNKAKLAYGGYLEKRGIYKRSEYFNELDTKKERNIHLGTDIWISEETPVFAPLDGIIHSFNNNTNYGDYGPTIILEHKINDYMFYTLYGHLSIESIKDKIVGVEVKSGMQIGTLGSANVNGDYPPHLHFQVIKDIQNYKGDYPGVTNENDLEFYKSNCPNPNALLRHY